MWQLALIVCIFLLSVAIILQRLIVHQGKSNPFAYAVVFQGLVGLILTAAALISGFDLSGVEQHWALAILCVVCFAIGHIVYALTLQRVEASLFSLLFATHAIWMMLVGVLLLGENLNWIQLLGALLIFGAITLPVLSRSIKLDRRGLVYGLLSGLLMAVALSAWSYIGRSVDSLSWSAITFLIPAVLAYCIRPSSLSKLRHVVAGTNLPKMLLLAAVYAGGSLAMLVAYKYGEFAVVSPIRQTGIIVTVLLALILIPSERTHIGLKLVAAVICALGTVLLVI